MTTPPSSVRAAIQRAGQSLSNRTVLLAVVAGWVLIVYLIAPVGRAHLTGSPARNRPPPAVPAGHGPASGGVPAAPYTTGPPTPAPSGPYQLAAAPPDNTTPVTAPSGTTAPSTTVPPFHPGGYTIPPPVVVTASCPLPLPKAPEPALSAPLLLSTLSPFLSIAGPLASYTFPTIGRIGPLLPLLSPLLSLSQPVLAEVGPWLPTILTPLATLEEKLGSDGPPWSTLAAKFLPDWTNFLGTLEPIEQKLDDLPVGGCLELALDNLAQIAGKLDLKLPSLPNPPASSAATPATAPALVTAAAVDGADQPTVTIPLAWSGGIDSSASADVRALAAKGVPVVVELIDTPPPGRSIGGQGFADFVAQTVHQMPGAAAFQVDAPSSCLACPARIDDLVHGLAAAATTRVVGQLVGLGLSTAATGVDAAAFWRAFAQAAHGWQPNLVDFIATALEPANATSPASAAAGAAQLLRAMEAQWTAIGGVGSSVPVFASLPLLHPGDTTSPAALVALLNAYHRALGPLHVGMLTLHE